MQKEVDDLEIVKEVEFISDKMQRKKGLWTTPTFLTWALEVEWYYLSFK